MFGSLITTDAACKPVHNITTVFATATFGMGCFWGCDCLFGATPGVLRTAVGYSGGSKVNPKYRDLGDQTEVIKIDYDAEKISFKQLLDLFWNNHEYGLTNKIKRQYMSLILYHNEEQKTIAEECLQEEQIKRNPEQIITEIIPAGTFYPAEDYHQKYRLQKHEELVKSLALTSELLQSSHVAAKLNGYIAGVGGVEQFLEEATELGLSKSQIDYIKKYVEENEGSGLYC